ncbi:hypothetical protein [Spirosoma sp.]|uniref:hypothetical protein n=1 Tax=Spirosoma sp. TaxID=1899569 RepID=UPI003B3AB2C9
MQTSTCLTRAFVLSTETRRTSKRPHLWDVRPVDRNAEMEANLWTRTQRPKGLMVNELVA